MFTSNGVGNNKAQVETVSYRTMRRDKSGKESNRENSQVNALTRSAPVSPLSSPLVSPNNGRNSDIVQYHYVSPPPNQYWSAPEMVGTDNTNATSSSVTMPPSFYDLANIPPNDISPHQSPKGKNPNQNVKSKSGASSPIHIRPNLSLETWSARRDFSVPSLTVHPLPLPPGAPLLSPSPKRSSPTLPKADSSLVKGQWQKGKLIGRGTFGSVYVATNRYMKFLEYVMILTYLHG